jgi:hypothetical protein
MHHAPMRDVFAWYYGILVTRLTEHEGEDGLRKIEQALYGDDVRDLVAMEDGSLRRAPSWWREDDYQRGSDMQIDADTVTMPSRTVTITAEEAWDIATGVSDAPDADKPARDRTPPDPVFAGHPHPVADPVDKSMVADVATAWDWSLPPEPDPVKIVSPVEGAIPETSPIRRSRRKPGTPVL